jgi:hypothetical protein
MGIFSIWKASKDQFSCQTSLPSFLHFKPRWLQTAEQAFSPKILLTWLQSLLCYPIPCSPSLSLCHSFVYFLYFCLRKPRDIHGTEVNNVEWKTKFLRSYPSNKTITICSEAKLPIIHCILNTTPSPVREKCCPFLGLSLCHKREWSVPFRFCKVKLSKYEWDHILQI